MYIYMLNRNKSTLKILGKVAMGVARASKNFPRSLPIHRAYRAVIFASAQLSCLNWKSAIGIGLLHYHGRNQGGTFKIVQGIHICGALRGNLCDSMAFLLNFVLSTQ